MKKGKDVFLLTGKTIFVAGGCGLLGLASAKALAARGAKVVMLDIDNKNAAAALNWARRHKYRLWYEYFNVCDLEGCAVNLQRLIKKHGPMHGLVNASFPHSPDWARRPNHMTVAYLRKNVDMHLNSHLWLSRVAGMSMQKAGIKGSIINFGSIYGVVGNDLTIYEGTPLFGEMTYSAIKGGLVNFNRFLASYFGRYGIRANCLCPGGIYAGEAASFVRNYSKKTLLKRMGSPQEVAHAVVFLASEASSYITGTTFMVDGGWTAT